MVLQKTVCLHRLSGSRGGELQAGRFFGNQKVTAAKIIDSSKEPTAKAVAGRHVLAIDDTSEIKFPTTAQRRRGLGPIGRGTTYGLLAHAMIAVDADSGACLGLVGGEIWTRPGVAITSHQDRPPEERESARWANAAEHAKRVLHQATMVTVVDDRESDIYAKWASVPTERCHLLTRARCDRRLADDAMLFATVAQCPLQGQREITLPARDPGRPKRTATLELRYASVTICRPESEWDRSLPETVTLRCIEVREVDAPDDVAPMLWRLLTTHEIADADNAWQVVGWYLLRWVIEQLFRAMKSQGLQLEDSQMTTAAGLEKLTALAVKAACIDIQLVQERDGAHHLPASVVFSEPEIETLAVLIPTLEGKTERQHNPYSPASLAWAAWAIARLGGWNCYYKPPGPITMHRGMQQFHSIHRGRMLEMRLQRDVRIP